MADTGHADVNVAEALVPVIVNGLPVPPCPHGVKGVCPCMWTPPNKRDTETDAQFAERLNLWSGQRARMAAILAKKHKVVIQLAPPVLAPAMLTKRKR